MKLHDITITNEDIQSVVNELEKGSVSGLFGNAIPDFENKVKKLCSTKYASATSSGTTALHLAIISTIYNHISGEIIVPSMTMAATIFPIIYEKHHPTIIDVKKDTWGIDVNLIEENINSRTRAIIPVHIYGNPCNMKKIMDIAKKYNLIVIEDCAEALGAMYDNQVVGGIGNCGCHSFYATKMITSGEGGMITTNNKDIYQSINNMKNMMFGLDERYNHIGVGYNYRMSNILAALGTSQIDRLQYNIERKREIFNIYKEELPDIEWQKETPNGFSVRWMSVGLTNYKHDIKKLMIKNNIYVGDVFTPLEIQKFVDLDYKCKNSNEIYEKGLLFPSNINLSDGNVMEICKIIKRYYER